MKNFIPLNRRIFKHYFWKERRVYSRFEAWLDLLQLVNFEVKKKKEFISGRLIEWGRGQYPVSLTFLEKRWLWSTSKIRTYIRLLKNDKMINIEKTQGITVITICKYDSYNTNQQGKNTQNDKSETNDKQEVKIDNKDKEILFRDSDFFDEVKFKASIGEKYLKYDLDFYYLSVLNWSDKGNERIDWLATARNFILKDIRDNKVKLKQTAKSKFVS